MPCKIQIKENINTEVETRSNPGFNMSFKGAQSLASKINQDFQSKVVEFYLEGDGVYRNVTISNELVDKYYAHELMIETKEAESVQKKDAERAGEEFDESYLFLQQSPVDDSSEVIRDLNQQLIDGFLKDFNITATEYDDLKRDLGVDALTASDLVTKSIAYEKGESILPEVAYFAYSILGKQNNKLRSELRYLVNKWDKYKERFDYHSRQVRFREGFIEDSQEWKNKIRDLVILDFLQEKIGQYYLNPTAFQKELDTKWTREDFTLWNKIVQFFEDILSRFSERYKHSNEKLSNIGLAIADEILNNNYEYFSYDLKEDQIQKYYNRTIESDPFAKDIVEFGQKELGIVLTGSLALRRAGTVFRTEDETLHDIDWVVPYDLNTSPENQNVLDKIKGYQGVDKEVSAKAAQSEIKNFTWFKKFVEKYPNYKLINSFYGAEHKSYESLTVQGVIDGQFYDKNGYHEEEISYYKKDPDTKRPIKAKKIVRVKHKKGDWIKDTGYVIDFFIRLAPHQEEHDNYFKLWKEIMIAKIKMGRDKDFIDWKVFVPYMKSKDSFNFNYKAFRHINYGNKNKEIFNNQKSIASVANDQTLEKVREVLNKMGVKLQELSQYATAAKLDLTGNNAVADVVRGIIAVAEGKEGASLTEEMVHIATAILEQKNPALVTQMISKIDRFKIYKKTFDEYKNNKLYQLPNGKPDIRKIKKEAVDKLITELIIKKNQGDTQFPELLEQENRSIITQWINAILDWFRGMYQASDIDIFEDVVDIAMSGELRFTEEFQEYAKKRYKESGRFLQINPETIDQRRIRDAVFDTANRLRKVESKETVDPILADTEEASNFYESQNADGSWSRITKRVTDRVKKFYGEVFKNKDFTKAEKELNEFKRKNGVKFHKFFENIYARYYDKTTGLRRASVLDNNMIYENRYDEEIYRTLEAYFQELMRFHSKDGKSPLLLSEVMIYDPVEKEAGTIDLLVIDDDGTTHIYDWKFMAIGEDSKDVAWYKQGAYKIQLGTYRDILAKSYGIKKFGRNRAIPIGFNFAKLNPRDPKSELYIKGIRIGSVSPNSEISLSLAPVAEERESTGVKELDNVLKILNDLHEQIGKIDVTTNEEKEFKSERLNILKRAARSAQINMDIAPLIEVITIMNKEGKNIITEYISKFEGKAPNDSTITNESISAMSEKMNEFLSISQAVSEVDVILKKMIYNDKMELDKASKELRIRLMNAFILEVAQIRESRIEIVDLSKSFADKFIGQRRSVTGLLNTEAVAGWFERSFRTVSELPQKAFKLLYKIINESKDQAIRDALVDISKIEEIKAKLEKRGDLKDAIKKIYQKNKKGSFTNKLIYKYQKAFYDMLDENAIEGNRDKNVIYDNVDMDAYNAEVKKIIDSRTEYIKQIYDEVEKQNELIEAEKKKWLVDRADFNGWNNYVLRRHPKDKHFSEEYIELKKDDDLFELYNYIVGVNEKAKEVGYLNNDASLTFLPFVRKSMAESLSTGVNVSTISNFLDNFNLRADDIGLGKINNLTGELEHSIPKYFTYDFTLKEDGSNDYSDVSEDLFKNMIMYVEQLHKYKYFSEVEEQIKMIRTVETFKAHYEQTSTGELVTKKGKPSELAKNEDTVKLFDKFVAVLLYGQKYPDGGDAAFDVKRIVNFLKGAVNKVANKKIYTIDDKPTPLSLVKTMDVANRAFQIKTLGFEFISGAVNAFGGNIQLATQAGNYFNAREVVKNEILLVGNKFKSDDDRKMFEQLIEVFMPLKDTPIYQRMLKAGMSPLTRVNMTDWLMIFMREPEQHLEKSIFKTLLDNMMVENGKIVSIKEFVKNKYKDRYKSGAEYRKYKSIIDKEIDQLKSTRSISATKKLEDGKLVIPGLDLSNTAEIQRLTNLTRTISRNATGGLSDVDINGMSMSVWTRSMMVFKNWIPKLVDTRFGEFRKVGDDFSVYINEDGQTMGEKYDIGRIRLWWSLMGFNIVQSANNIIDIITMNDAGLEKLNQMYDEYAAKYERDTGEPLTMSREDFYDLIRTNLRNQMKELSILIAVSAAVFAVGMLPPDEDDNKAERNRFRFVQRVLDKFQSELLFFYNPVELQGIISGSIFPAVGLLTDLTRFITHMTMELTGVDLSDPTKSFEEVREKAQPVKQLARMFPFTKSMITYGAILDAEFAKEFDVTIQKESRR
jgi:hypothetical protein